jgi:hypothetical protein
MKNNLSVKIFHIFFVIILLASCSKKDIQVPKKQTYFIRVGAVNPTDTVYSNIIKAR